MKRTISIAVIPGDGIGPEVVHSALEVLDAVATKHNILLASHEFPWGCEHLTRTGRLMDEDAIDKLRTFDAILLGAVGCPKVPDHVSLWGLLIPIRRSLQQYVNVRPIRLLDGIRTPLKDRLPHDIDLVIVRENVEGEYSEIGGRLYAGTDMETVVQTAIFTRAGVDRVLEYAFELARTRGDKHITSATKSNGIIHTMPFWDERFAAFSQRNQDIRADQYHIDILTAHFVQHPDWFDVVVASNLFGDILSDLGPAIAGGVGIAPSGNLNPSRTYPSMFEPVHGSAPDIAGRGIANPIATIWSVQMMLDFLGETNAASDLMRAIEAVAADGAAATPDLGGRATTRDVTRAVVSAVNT